MEITRTAVGIAKVVLFILGIEARLKNYVYNKMNHYFMSFRKSLRISYKVELTVLYIIIAFFVIASHHTSHYVVFL